MLLYRSLREVLCFILGEVSEPDLFGCVWGFDGDRFVCCGQVCLGLVGCGLLDAKPYGIEVVVFREGD